MDYRIFNMRTDINACDCAQGCTDTRKRVFTESWLWEKNPLLNQRIEPVSAVWRSDALTNWATSQPSAHCSKISFIFWPMCCRCVLLISVNDLIYLFKWITDGVYLCGWIFFFFMCLDDCVPVYLNKWLCLLPKVVDSVDHCWLL